MIHRTVSEVSRFFSGGEMARHLTLIGAPALLVAMVLFLAGCNLFDPGRAHRQWEAEAGSGCRTTPAISPDGTFCIGGRRVGAGLPPAVCFVRPVRESGECLRVVKVG